VSEAMAKAKSTDPVKVAAAMEGLKFKGFNGEVEVRKLGSSPSGPRPTPRTRTARKTPA